MSRLDSISEEDRKKMDLFAEEFAALCNRHDVNAAYLAVVSAVDYPGQAALLTGGEEKTCDYLKKSVAYYTNKKAWSH